MSPCARWPASRRWTSPSISGASALERPVAPPSAIDRVDDHVDRAADLGRELGGGDGGGLLHEAGVALLLDLLGHDAGQGVGGGAADRLEAEGADAVELGLVEPVEQIVEILLGLAGEADDEGRADGDVGADLAPARGSARAPWPRWPAASSPSAPSGWHAGRGCRDRGGPAPRPSAG